MRSMFSNASFSRFDLGAHALGQISCPVGQTPMKERNGEIVCMPYSPSSGMFMPQGPNTGIAYGMGQVAPVKEGIPTQNLVITGVAAVGLAFLISAFV